MVLPALDRCLEELHDLRAGLGVEVAGRLVGQEDGGPVDQRARDGHALALAAGQFVGPVMHAVGQPHFGQRVERRSPPLFRGHAGIDQRQLDVAQGGGPRQQVEGLEDEADLPVADLGELVVVHLADVDAVELVLARGGRVQAADQVHQGGLARAGRAHDGHVLAALDVQRDVPQGVDRLGAHLVAPRNVLESDQAHKPVLALSASPAAGRS